jgi:predicted dienelactone hydrolase
MRIGHLVVLAIALGAVPGATGGATPAATCMRASGNAAARCLDRYADVVARCRARRDAACEEAARADGGALDGALGRVAEPDAHACTDDSSAPLDYTSAADVVVRGSEGCTDFAEDWVDLAFAAHPTSPADAFLACQHEVAHQLGRLRDATVRLEGARCYLPAYRGEGCDRTRRDARLAAARDRARHRIAGTCGGGFDALGLGSLDDVIENVFDHARHFAQLVYPPEDLGPTADPGPYPVGVRTLMLLDPSRLNVQGTGPRPVTVEVYYPSTPAAVAGVPRDIVSVLGVPVAETRSFRDVAIAQGPFPLVLFSHGNDGIRFQSFFFASHLASHGYVVVSPDHHGNTFVDALLGIVDPNVVVNRPLDMSFLIDQFSTFTAETGNAFDGAIDVTHIGASGHSFGGYTVFAIAGGTSPLGTFTDPRVRAILPQAPAAPFPPEFFETITIPTLILGGSIDETTPFDTQQLVPFESIPSGASVVALGQLTGAGHFTFSDFCEVQRDLLAFLGGFDEACQPRHLPWRRAHDIVNYLSLNFFDAVLRGDAAALGRVDPQVVAGIEDLRFWRK